MKNLKKKEKTKFKVGDIIKLNDPMYIEDPNICLVMNVGTKYYKLYWLAESMFFNQGEIAKSEINHTDKTSKRFRG